MKDGKFMVFISLGMNGRSDEEVFTRIAEIKDEVYRHLYSRGFDKEDIGFIDTYVQDMAPECENPRLHYLGESIKRMRDANLIYLDKDWSKFNGCYIEAQIAHVYHIPTVYSSDSGTFIVYPNDVAHDIFYGEKSIVEEW